MRAELAARGGAFAGELVSIYLGGGTPGLWRPDCVADAIVAIVERYGAAHLREVTIEANPTDCTDERLAAWCAAGITRVSIGVQSLEPSELIVLGRDHRHGDGRAAVERARAAGLVACADFILGTPGGGGAGRGLGRGAAGIEALGAEHLSVYELTIADRTVFAKRVKLGRLTPLDEDVLATLYTDAHALLTAQGYEHYEISNYARPGRRAVHNGLYWQGAAVLGLGVGAASLELRPDGTGVRQTNPRRFRDYEPAPGRPADLQALGASDLALERAWLGLRTSDGVPEAALEAARGVADELVAGGVAERRAGRICPTLRGFLMADWIASRIVQCWDDASAAAL